jgi:hypothetical protein
MPVSVNYRQPFDRGFHPGLQIEGTEGFEKLPRTLKNQDKPKKAAQQARGGRRSGERTRPECWFRRPAETNFST